MQLLQTFDYVQHVKEATHKDNHILDLIISRSDDHIVCRPSVQDPALSDHYAVRCKFLLAKPSFKRKEIAYRNLKRINFDRFREDIINSALMESDALSLDDLIGQYNTTLTSLLNDHAPIRKKVVTLRPANPWLTPEIQKEKVTRRRLERRWRRTRLTVDRELYTQQCAVVCKLIRGAKERYYSELIAELSSDPRELFRTLETLLKGRTERLYPPVTSPEVLPNRFADYFEQKISNIRTELDLRRTEVQNPFPDSSQRHSDAQLGHFTPVTTTQLANLISKTARKSCDLDPIPATVLRECLSNLLPIITKIVNMSLTEAVVPSSLKNRSAMRTCVGFQSNRG